MKKLPENSVDSIVTDPPYHLVSIVKRFGGENSRNTPAMNTKEGGVFARKAKGFMGKEWDGVDENGMGIANNPEMWREAMRVLKPGGHLLAFSGTRTYHRMASAIEDAGFEVRDMIEWVYGSGFPKSLNIGKAVDKLQGNEREVKEERGGAIQKGSVAWSGNDRTEGKGSGFKEKFTDTKGTSEWEGWGTALKPAHEPICMARKPLAESTVASNVLKYGTGGINIDESRVGTEERFNSFAGNKDTGFTADDTRTDAGKGLYAGNKDGGTTVNGRFPANLIHDNSEEVRECFPETKSGKAGKDGHKRKDSLNYESNINYADRSENAGELYGDSGNASRFFKSIIYKSKASKKDRGVGNNHPTVKSIDLMAYLIKMVTPKGGTVLDPFMGSGTTGVACKNLNRNFIGIELDENYYNIAKQRIENTPITNEDNLK